MDTENLNQPENLNDQEIESRPEEGLFKTTRLSGMYTDWFLDYASYVILERAVPHLYDGLKPVQRRILHAMKRLDDGRYNKVANIVGHTMQFHPHGDASIGDALVQLGQKDLLIDTQGNWGNILTGDSAAAPRYIEARLTKFALDVVFNPKTTDWQASYDGRNKEPITFPVKFPLLLAQGVEGIAVGLASKILPHNFNELLDACIAYLKNQDFELYPDFPTGGMIDVSKYNDGIRGGAVKVRAKITKLDKKTLVITELPFGRNTTSLIDSILKANEKGKIKIRKIDDNTAANVEILVHLPANISPDQTIDALYAFTDCEVSISPNSCVIEDDKPKFLGVSHMLKVSADHTKYLLTRELEIRKAELEEQWHMSSLEKIFIEERIYRDIEECETWEAVLETIDRGLDPFKPKLLREVTQEDIIKLTEIKIKRISKFDTKKADEYIRGLEDEIEEVKNHLANIVPYTINYFKQIKKKHGKDKERKTEIRSFENIEATKVVVANTKLYGNFAEGFIGTSLKKDEFICECSDIDDILVIRKDGKYMITKVASKVFVGKNILFAGVWKKNDKRTIYNVVYRDGKEGNIMMKRCAITGLTRDKEYDLTKGTESSRVVYLTQNPNGEAEVLKVYLKPRARMRNPIIELNFADLAVKGRGSMGNILSRYPIHKISLKEKGVSTLGGRKIYFEDVVKRLNADGRGKFLGEFSGNDRILVITKDGKFRTCDFDLSNHFHEEILHMEKLDTRKIYSVVFYEAEQGFIYLKRFNFEDVSRLTSFIGDHSDSKILTWSSDQYARYEVVFGGEHIHRDAEVIEADEFIAVKSFKARGKRLSTYEVDSVQNLEALKEDDPVEEPPLEEEDDSQEQMALDL
jgi:topoisomerase-4 subunit A